MAGNVWAWGWSHLKEGADGKAPDHAEAIRFDMPGGGQASAGASASTLGGAFFARAFLGATLAGVFVVKVSTV